MEKNGGAGHETHMRMRCRRLSSLACALRNLTDGVALLGELGGDFDIPAAAKVFAGHTLADPRKVRSRLMGGGRGDERHPGPCDLS